MAPATSVVPGVRALPPTRGRRTVWVALLLLAAGLVLLLSPLIGLLPSSIAIPPLRALEIVLSGGGALFNPCAGAGAECARAWIPIVWQERVPVVLLAVIVGGALGLSGATLQGIFRNPLADPFLLGISTGGTLGASLVFVFAIGEAEADLALPLFAFLGSLGTGLLILAAARGRYGSVETLLLTGVALNAFLSSVLTVILLYNPTASLQVDFWLLGSLGGGSSVTWARDGIAFGGVLAAGTVIAIHGRELNLLQLGNDVAQSAGVDSRRIRNRLLLLTSVVTAVAVAFTGIIGFVGLVSPHVVRRVAGSDYRIVLPGAVVVGAAFLLGARDLSALAFPGDVLPIGIFTSFAGAPFFLYLLYRRRRLTTMGDM
ncbi:MAG: iron ABC transporter permease [Thermoplasmata archaeon]|nr:iron ABC transporter permease [Thermoplasmata archaeon]